MNHHFYHLLVDWHAHRDEGRWVLVTVIGTQGSAYRKRGACMLFNDNGRQLGLISGGCLEQDVFHHARKCWDTQSSRQVTYDMQEEGDIAWRLGIGCGGEVRLLLQPVSEQNQYLCLDKVLQALEQGQSVDYAQYLGTGPANSTLEPVAPDSKDWFVHRLTPPVNLVILGGGVDAQPVARLAVDLGWLVTVNDPRARYARENDFPFARRVDNREPEELHQCQWLYRAQAVIVMHHQVGLDARALKNLVQTALPNLGYLALLGPFHRSEKVLLEAQLTEADLPVTLQAPAGLAIGGELPESIALSMLAQAHAMLHQRSGAPLKGQPCSIG